ncbi:unnamed protein product [Ambrosiozyma monospora]|uniref:Pre-mRNA-splicing factor CWC15 n=1 Tax=Ambrosiozyma monospora TaxID=43982 RepID=A0A9W6YX48_AMBMO|nr:unnamed protein product [Ambrosiozyma monospora]
MYNNGLVPCSKFQVPSSKFQLVPPHLSSSTLPNNRQQTTDNRQQTTMTTAHRPTFDHAKGKQNLISSSIKHKRSLPAHKALKFRKRQKLIHEDFDDDDDDDTPENAYGLKLDHRKTKKSVDELKKELLMLENGQKQHTSSIHLKVENDDDNDDDDDDEDVQETDPVELQQRRQQLLVETKDIDFSSESENESRSDDDEDNSSSGSDSGSGSGSESESEDEDAELLKELANIKKEKEAKRIRQEEIELTQKAIHSNPLIKLSESDDENALNGINGDDDDDEMEEKKPIKKSWRSTTAFTNRKNKNDGSNKNSNGSTDIAFVNDMLKSDFHKRFMDRYIK